MNYIKNRIKGRGTASGFTLVELVVAFAILSVVTLIIAIMMNSGTNFFTKINTRVNMSYKTQIAMVQLRELLIDCDAVCQETDGSVTYTYFSGYNESDDRVVYCVSCDTSKKDAKIKVAEIAFATFKGLDADGLSKLKNELSDSVTSNTYANPLVSHISGFDVTFTVTDNEGDDEKAGLVELVVEATMSGNRYSKNQTINLRNFPVLNTADNSDNPREDFIEAAENYAAKFDGGSST